MRPCPFARDRVIPLLDLDGVFRCMRLMARDAPHRSCDRLAADKCIRDGFGYP